ncbi:calcium:proton antiporter [Brachybacterium hainanense]|uniref:Calcium:proton antiporter n=1 Tax=Brachybacterium hainanense TaxID=1541174 RepID=A0ABV6RGH1_9MICO
MPASSVPLRSLLTRAALVRLALGWGAVAGLGLAAPLLAAPLPGPALAALLAAIVAVILLCAFGVVHEAEHLAHRLGDPYGSLVLTLSIVLIEVVLIAAVMLGPGEHATIARDSVMAVSMIIMNLVVGLCLLLGGMRHGDLAPHPTGASAYLAMITVLGSLGLAVPALLSGAGTLGTGQAVVVVVLTIGLYAFFLARQMGRQAADFREVDGPSADPEAPAQEEPPASIGAVLAAHRREILGRFALLVATVLPIVLLSHDMADLLDDGLARLGAPTALAGLVIAMIVFLPESITAVRAALGGELQRVLNLCHGALVSTVGLTIPVVLVIGMVTGQDVVLGETPIDLLLLGATVMLSGIGLAGRRLGAMHGAAHLALFGVFALTLLTA